MIEHSRPRLKIISRIDVLPEQDLPIWAAQDANRTLYILSQAESPEATTEIFNMEQLRFNRLPQAKKDALNAEFETRELRDRTSNGPSSA